MAKFHGDRLSNRGSKLHYLADDAATSYTLLALGSDFTGPRYTGTTGDGMTFEDGGHAHPVPQTRRGTGTLTVKFNFGVARPTFKVFDYIHFVKEYEDGFGLHIFVLITDIDYGAFSPNGLPQMTMTYEALAEPDDIAVAELADFLALLGAFAPAPGP